MKFSRLLKVAFISIIRVKLRSLLTTLGIIIGTASVIIMVGVGQGAQSNIEKQIQSLGSNLIIIAPGSSKSGGVRGGHGSFNRFTMTDVENIQEQSINLGAISPVLARFFQVIGGGNNWNTQVFGVSEQYPLIREWKVETGNFFGEREIAGRAKVAVLGKETAEELFGNSNPVGEQIRIKNIPFKIIGVLEEKGQSMTGRSNDDLILIPISSMLYRLSGSRYISFIFASAKSVENIDQAQNEVIKIMRKSHNINPGQDDDFMVQNQTEITEAATETSQVMTLLLGAVAGVSLLVGGIGIMNIMYVSVTERTREIGIRLSVGAREQDILLQFLLEAMTLSIIGGVFGILFSILTIYLLNEFSNLTAVINPLIIIIAVLFSAFVGIFFGFYPAKKAAELDPIIALRHE
ncbi:MAG: ABC transporter permease [Melioribacteraceae bacterium]|nr:MAG: ABC transporter permease [Melioribacteraceae bacterium]